jgi:signal transduction histidine kinase
MMARLLRALALALVVLIVVSGWLTVPDPGLTGERLGILVGLAGVAVGTLGLIRFALHNMSAFVLLFTLLVSSSLVLVWLQPNGNGFLGIFLAVSAAAFLLSPSTSAVVAIATVVALVLVAVLAGGRSFASLASNALGVAAFYVIAVLARRLGEGQQQAQRLLLELEESRAAQAQAAAIAERQRLARDMHDVLAHSLSGLVLQLEGARLLAAQRKADPDLVAAVERAHRLAKGGLEEARRAIGLLRDDELPGPERLPALAQSFAADTGIPCTLEVTGTERALGSEARLTLYRVAQEALTNVRKHAMPTRVEMHLFYEAEGTRLTVEDFGASGHIAFSPDGDGYGLTGMRERAELLGGRLTATGTTGGFRVALWVPE